MLNSMQKISLYSVFVCLVFYSANFALAGNKIKAGFMGQLDIPILPTMAQSGMNTAIVVFGDMQYPFVAKNISDLAKWVSACEFANLNLIVAINYWGAVEKTWMNPDYKYFTGGKTFNNPCPFNAYNYNKIVNDRFIAIAKESLTRPIYGIALDTEMYGGDHIAYTDLCFCDDCWARYQTAVPGTVAKKTSERQAYIASIGQTDKYRQVMVSQLATLAAATRSEVTKINPNFVVAVLKLDQINAFTEGLARGFSLESNPVWILSEYTYSAGHTNYITESINKFAQMDIYAKFCTGIWQDKFSVEYLAEQYYFCAKDSAGYWIYTMQTLNPSWKPALLASRQSYWDAIKLANKEISAYEANSGYQTSLQLREIKRPLEDLDYSKISVYSLAKAAPTQTIDTQTGLLNFHSTHKLPFIAEKGDKIQFSIKFIQRPDTKIHYAKAAITTKSGQVLTETEVDAQKEAVITTVAPSAGTYMLVLNPERNMLNITSFTHPYSIDASKWPLAHFIRPSVPIYLWQPPNSKKAKVLFFVDGVGESIIAKFSTEDGKQLATFDILAKQSVQFSLPECPSGQVLVLTVKPRPNTYFEDVFITIESGLGKYISPFKSGLLKEGSEK